MAIWDDLYNSLPRQGYNPGYGAREFQGLKSRIVARISVGHIFGQDETDSGFTGGKHKEGSARVSVVDDLEGASPRADYRISAVATGDEGRVEMNLADRATNLKVNDVFDDTNDVATRYSIIKVVADLDDVGGTEVVSIFDYDRMMNLTYDQTISGTKTFGDHVLVPNVTTELATILDSDTLDPAETGEDLLNPLNIGQGRTKIKVARDMNIFDASDAYNTIETVDGLDYTMHTINCQAVYARNIYGAVWG